MIIKSLYVKIYFSIGMFKINSALLIRIGSKVLSQRLKIPFETDIEKELREQLAEKEEVIKNMEIQLEFFLFAKTIIISDKT